MKTLFAFLASCLTASAAISFTGGSDFATVKDSPSLNFTNNITYYYSALKRGRTAVNSYFVFGKGTSAYNYGADYITVGGPYSFEFQWNDPALFAQNFSQPATPGIVTNVWASVAFRYNWGAVDGTFYDRGAIDTGLTCGAGNCARIPTMLAEPLEIAKGRGGFAKWNGAIGEIAIWNTNLTTRQLQILSGCKIKGMARQIRPTNLVMYVSMDQFASGTSMDGTNIIRDYSGFANHASPIATPLSYPEGYASYLPNE